MTKTKDGSIQVWDGDGARMHGNPRDRKASKERNEKFETLADWEDRLYKKEGSFGRLVEVVGDGQENARWYRAAGRQAGMFLTGIGLAMMLTAPFVMSGWREILAYFIPAMISFICGVITIKAISSPPNRTPSMDELNDLWGSDLHVSRKPKFPKQDEIST